MTAIWFIGLGLLFGWLIEWVIDWIWWRRPKKTVSQHTIELKEMLDGMSPEGDLQAKLATWFDHVMDRSSGEYKRRVSKRALLIGTILAFAFNVDSIQIATSLWREPTLRQVIVAQANNQVNNPGQPTPLPDQVSQLGIPVGWSTKNLPTDSQRWLLKIIGLLISGIATAQGAPFWFDILKKMINLRSSGPVPNSERSDNTSTS